MEPQTQIHPHDETHHPPPRRVGRGRISAATRVLIRDRDGNRCLMCGRTSLDVTLHIDHIVPVVAGGSDELENLATLCSACNLGKGARIDLTLAGLRARLAELDARRAADLAALVAKEQESRRQKALADIARQHAALESLEKLRRREAQQRAEHHAADLQRQKENAAAQERARIQEQLRLNQLIDIGEDLHRLFGHYWADRVLIRWLDVFTIAEILSTLRWVERLDDVADPQSRWRIFCRALETRSRKRQQATSGQGS